MKLLVPIACSVALLAACGSDSDNTAQNTTPATASTSTASPQSTTTIALAPITVAPTTAATVVLTVAETTPEATPPPETSDPETSDTTEPDTTSDTESTESSGSETSVASTDAPTTSAAAGQYTEVAPPVVPSVSAQVLADSSHPDGVYYATVTEGGDPPPATGEIVFELVQLFRGDECTEHFGADDEDACVNDYGVETDPTATLAVPLKDQFISVADAATQKSLLISGAELYSLIHGDDPSAGAPDGYTYVGFAYFLTISGGNVTRLEQWWTP